MRRAFMLVEIMIVIVIIGLLASMAIPAFMHVTRGNRDVYESWCKLEHRTDISYEEWQKLRSAGLITRHSK